MHHIKNRMNFQVHVCACVGRVQKVSLGNDDSLFWRSSGPTEDFGLKNKNA